jgi:dihydrolipoamide dehydrogenase
VRLDVVPHVLHTVSPIAWVGLSAAEAGAAGYDVDVAMVDLGWSARGITLGGREGVLTLVVDREFGQVLGASAVGPEAGEIIAVAALAVTSELTVDDLASSVQWHPSAAENLTDAARQLVGS